MRNSNIERAVKLALITAGSLAAGAYGTAAWAQERDQPQASQAQSAELEQVVVTGSRISRPDLDAASPVTVVDRAQHRGFRHQRHRQSRAANALDVRFAHRHDDEQRR